MTSVRFERLMEVYKSIERDYQRMTELFMEMEFRKDE